MIVCDLFDKHYVNISSKSLQMGGSWDKSASAQSQDLIEFTYNYIKNQIHKHNLESFVLLDIGANTGSFCLLAKFIPQLTVHAFEPNPQTFFILEKNIRLNSLQKRVFAYNVALDDNDGFARLLIPEQSGLASLSQNPTRFDATVAHKHFVATKKLDNIPNISQVHLCKLDTEGWEYFILKGAQNTLLETSVPLILEFDARNMKQCQINPQKFYNFLKNWYPSIQNITKSDLLCTKLE